MDIDSEIGSCDMQVWDRVPLDMGVRVEREGRWYKVLETKVGRRENAPLQTSLLPLSMMKCLCDIITKSED